MTWNTPLGHRVLQGTERLIIDAAIHRMTRETLTSLSTIRFRWYIPVFDSMNGCQQLVMLDLRTALLIEKTEEANAMTAVVEGTAVRYLPTSMARLDELDTEKDADSVEPRLKPERFWRRLLLKANREYGWELKPRRDPFEWEFVVSSAYTIASCMMWITQWILRRRPPEASNAVNATMGIPEITSRRYRCLNPTALRCSYLFEDCFRSFHRSFLPDDSCRSEALKTKKPSDRGR